MNARLFEQLMLVNTSNAAWLEITCVIQREKLLTCHQLPGCGYPNFGGLKGNPKETTPCWAPILEVPTLQQPHTSHLLRGHELLQLALT